MSPSIATVAMDRCGEVAIVPQVICFTAVVAGCFVRVMLILSSVVVVVVVGRGVVGILRNGAIVETDSPFFIFDLQVPFLC